MSRYARQMILPQIGEAGQRALEAAHVLVIGAGGLGCPVLQYLVGAGVGRITLVDGDVVSESNLHRQILYRMDDIGAPKAKAAATAMAALNPDCQITTVTEPLTPANVNDLLQDVTIALDCADSFAASYILSDACLASQTPLISASALGTTGYVGGFCAAAPSLRAVFPELPQTAANCATAGVMGPVVGTIGALQAQMALCVLLGTQPSPLGQLMTLNLSDFSTGGFRFDGAPEPDANDALCFIAPHQITATDRVIELRPEAEAQDPVIPRAERHLVPDMSHITLTPPTARTVLTCRSGLRAWQAARALQARGQADFALIAMGDTPSLLTDP